LAAFSASARLARLLTEPETEVTPVGVDWSLRGNLEIVFSIVYAIVMVKFGNWFQY
jgi:hypothetical protein